MTTPVHYSLLGHCYSSFHSDSLLNPNDQGEYVKFSVSVSGTRNIEQLYYGKKKNVTQL